jgi:alkylhydroperoxidase family enzyme
VIAYAVELARMATITQETFDRLRAHLPDAADFVEVHMAAALPNLTNRVNNPFQTDLEPGVTAFRP